MKRKNKSKIESKIFYYRAVLNIFLSKLPPDRILQAYLQGDCIELQDWIGMHLKDEIMDWVTTIGIIDACDCIVQSAQSNGNIKI